MTIFKAYLLGIFLGASALAMGSVAPSGLAAGLPETIKFLSIQDLSGLAGKPGADTQKGMDLAVEEINRSNLLGGSKIEITYRDSATNPGQGASAMSTAISQGYPIVFGSVASNVAVAEAPIAQRGHQPLIFTQAGSKGVLEAGEYIYRATPIQTDYVHVTVEYLQKLGIKRLAMLSDSTLPTINDLRVIVRDLAEKGHIEVVDDEQTPSSATDVSTQVTKIIDSKPDAVMVMMFAGRNVTGVSLLRQNGYKGYIAGQIGMGGGALAPIGAVADGVVWTTDFNSKQTNEGAVKFTAAYKAKFNGQIPPFYAAEGYDAVYFGALGLKKAGSTDPEAVIKGLEAVGNEGFSGVLGQIKFSGRQEMGSGVLVEWKNGEEVPIR